MVNRTSVHLCSNIHLQKYRYAKEEPSRLYRVIISQLRGGMLQYLRVVWLESAGICKPAAGSRRPQCSPGFIVVTIKVFSTAVFSPN